MSRDLPKMIESSFMFFRGIGQSHSFGTHKDKPYEAELRDRHVFLIYPVKTLLNTFPADVRVSPSNHVQRFEPPWMSQADLPWPVPWDTFMGYILENSQTHFEFESSMFELNSAYMSNNVSVNRL